MSAQDTLHRMKQEDTGSVCMKTDISSDGIHRKTERLTPMVQCLCIEVTMIVHGLHKI